MCRPSITIRLFSIWNTEHIYCQPFSPLFLVCRAGIQPVLIKQEYNSSILHLFYSRTYPEHVAWGIALARTAICRAASLTLGEAPSSAFTRALFWALNITCSDILTHIIKILPDTKYLILSRNQQSWVLLSLFSNAFPPPTNIIQTIVIQCSQQENTLLFAAGLAKLCVLTFLHLKIFYLDSEQFSLLHVDHAYSIPGVKWRNIQLRPQWDIKTKKIQIWKSSGKWWCLQDWIFKEANTGVFASSWHFLWHSSLFLTF